VKDALEVIHMDICTFSTKSYSRSKYFITFIDDYNRKTWVHFLKKNSKTLSAFKNFKNMKLKRRQRNWSKSLDQIKAMNTLTMNSTTIIDIMGLKGNLVKFTLFNKMVSLRGLKHDSY
jgi:uncharacterized protein YPO0396